MTVQIESLGTDQNSTATSIAITGVTTTNAPSRLVVVYMAEANGGTMPTVASVVGAGLTWTRRSQNAFASTDRQIIEVWYADLAAPITLQTITVTTSATYDDATLMVANYYSDAALNVMWDANVSLPKLLTGSTGTSAIATDGTAPRVLALTGDSDSNTPGGATPGWLAQRQFVQNSGASLWEYSYWFDGLPGAALSGTTVGFASVFPTANVTLDALVEGNAVVQSPGAGGAAAVGTPGLPNPVGVPANGAMGLASAGIANPAFVHAASGQALSSPGMPAEAEVSPAAKAGAFASGAPVLSGGTIPSDEPGYGYTSRTRSFLATPTVAPPVTPVPPATPLATLGIPRVSETYPQPVVLTGIPYADTAKTPWLPSSTASGVWAKQLQVIINNQDVTFFRDAPAVVQNWGSQEPFGDSAASVLLPGVTSFDHLPVPQALPIGEVVGIAGTYTGQGYWQASALGLVTSYGDAAYFGDVLGLLDQSITGIASHPSGMGYALVAADGGVFCQPTGTMVRVVRLECDRHGTTSRYAYKKCRCELCRAAVVADRRRSAGGSPRKKGTQPVVEEIPIEAVRPGDRVVSYNVGSRVLRRRNCHLVTEVIRRHHSGRLIRVTTEDGLTSRYTPEHTCIAYLGDALTGKHIVYLMRRGNQYRVGRTQGRQPGDGATGLAIRCRGEGGDAMWVLSVHDTVREAVLAEALVGHQFNIPTWCFINRKSAPDAVDLDTFWGKVGDNSESAGACLRAYGRDIRFPFWSPAAGNRWTRSPRTYAACNLLDGMRVLSADAGAYRRSPARSGATFEVTETASRPVRVTEEYWDGDVVSLDVEGDHTYVADGIITHNCYGDVPFVGSLPGLHVTPTAPIVGIAISSTGNGYWLVGQDGGVFAFGDAFFHGTGPVVFPSDVATGITRSSGCNGYVIVSRAGGVYALGDAGYDGNGIPFYEAPYTAVAHHPGTDGYLLVNSLGAAYAFGGMTYDGGCTFPLDQPVNSVAVTPSGNGYWMNAGDGGVFAFGDAPFLGSIPGGGTTDFGSLSWLRLGANITINYIDASNVAHTLFEGVVADWEDAAAAGADTGLTVQCVGAVFQLDWYVAKPIFDLPFLGYNPDTGAPVFGWDIGTAISTAINSAITNPTPGTAIGQGWTPPEAPGGSPLNIAYCQPVNTGIMTVQQPQWDKLLTGYIQNILAQAQTLGGAQWTVGLSRPRTPVIELKNLEGIDWTVACGARGVAHHLSLDITTAANAIYGQGTAPTTYLSAPQTRVSVEFYESTVLGLSGSWANSQYPQIPPSNPGFPLGGGQAYLPGSATTGFQPFTNWMRQCGYLMQSQNTYLSSNVNAGVLDQVLIENFQQFAGLQVTGNVDAVTWNAAFAVGQNSGSITAVHYAPLAELPEVEPYTYTPSGATVGNNPAYQSRIPRIERFEQMGQQITKAQGMLSAQIELERVQVPSWTGSIELSADPQEGSRFQIVAGQNVLLRFFHGQDTLFHISAVQHDFTKLTSTLTVSTQAMDLPTLASVWARDAQAHGVARQARPNLVNLNVSHNTTVFDSESGAGRVPLTPLAGNQWTVVRVPFSQAGSVAEIDLTSTSPATQFAMAVFSGPVSNADLITAGMGAPLTANGDGNSPWNDSASALDNLGLLYAAGGPSAGCGFWPSDPQSATPTLTGRYVDGNTWSYAPAPGYSPWLWVAFWVATGCAIQGNFRVAPTSSGG